MSHLHTEVQIEGTAAAVWAVLSDFPAYARWNPFITSIEGELREGARLRVRLSPPGGPAATFKPIVVTADRDREFRWLGRVSFLGVSLLDGEHHFVIEPTGSGRVRFVHGELFTGLLAPIMSRLGAKKTRLGFEQMNEALKTRVERGPSAAAPGVPMDTASA